MEWKAIDGFPYEVSNRGVVRRLGGNVVKPRPNQKGHLRVTLSDRDDKRDFLVRRLVAEAFIPNPESRPFVRHKDFDRLNVVADNLEWCTHKEGLAKAQEAGRFRAAVSPARAKTLTAELVARIYALRKGGMKFDDIASTLGVGVEACRQVCNGRTWPDANRPPLTRAKRTSPKP